MAAKAEVRRPFANGTICPEESLTRQSEMADADINTILRRFEATGVLPVMQREALFVDVTKVGDFQAVQEHILNAQAAFAQMPAEVRREFDNDPAVFLDQAVDGAYKEKFQRLGILEKDPTPGEAARAAVAASEAAVKPAT